MANTDEKPKTNYAAFIPMLLVVGILGYVLYSANKQSS